ncbi:MAG: hypothetical protein KTR24_16515 [Saprospiraceae bacterium]|nr:hypothetical protein [Saprospiraceae bacterium]
MAAIKIGIALTTLFLLTSCGKDTSRGIDLKMDHTHHQALEGIRLGDGVPVDLHINVRWRVISSRSFLRQHQSIEHYQESTMGPRIRELVEVQSNYFSSVDSVFGPQRTDYLRELKQHLALSLADGVIQVKEIIVPQIAFPSAFTEAKEAIGLQSQVLTHIAEQNRVDLAEAEAERKRTEAHNKIRITQAEADGRLQKIQAQMEKDRRASELARAETESQVAKMKTDAESQRRLVLAKAELQKQRQLKNLELEKRREIDELELERERKAKALVYEEQVQLAELCTNNPLYASFLVNRELAGQVEIAVLPTGTNPNVFKDLLHHNMPSNAKINSVDINNN